MAISEYTALMEGDGWIKLQGDNKILSASRAPKVWKNSGFTRDFSGQEFPIPELWIPVWAFILLGEENLLDKTMGVSNTKKHRAIEELNRVASSRQAQVALVTEYIISHRAKALGHIRNLCHNFIETINNESKVKHKED